MIEDLSTPGPLLDAKIARTLWRALVVHDPATGESYLMSNDYHHVPVPAYSTEVEDAYRVVEWMQDRGWALALKHEADHWVATFGRTDGRQYLYARGDTMAHFICVAALWALAGNNVR